MAPPYFCLSVASCGRRWTIQTSIKGVALCIRNSTLWYNGLAISIIGIEDRFSIRSASATLLCHLHRPFLPFTILLLHNHCPAVGGQPHQHPFLERAAVFSNLCPEF